MEFILPIVLRTGLRVWLLCANVISYREEEESLLLLLDGRRSSPEEAGSRQRRQ